MHDDLDSFLSEDEVLLDSPRGPQHCLEMPISMLHVSYACLHACVGLVTGGKSCGTPAGKFLAVRSINKQNWSKEFSVKLKISFQISIKMAPAVHALCTLRACSVHSTCQLRYLYPWYRPHTDTIYTCV